MHHMVRQGRDEDGLACARRPPPAPSRGWGTRLRRGIIRVIVVAIGAFAVVRAGFVIAVDDLSHPETYRNDWGGPHYIGVMAIHVGPAVLVLCLTALRLHRRRNTHQHTAHRNAITTRGRDWVRQPLRPHATGARSA